MGTRRANPVLDNFTMERLELIVALSVSSPTPGRDHRDGSKRTLFVNLEGSITGPLS
jgi:hypothetical protein